MLGFVVFFPSWIFFSPCFKYLCLCFSLLYIFHQLCGETSPAWFNGWANKPNYLHKHWSARGNTHKHTNTQSSCFPFKEKSMKLKLSFCRTVTLHFTTFKKTYICHCSCQRCILFHHSSDCDASAVHIGFEIPKSDYVNAL